MDTDYPGQRIMRPAFIITSAIVFLVVSGCESKMQKMPDKELKQERSHCKQLKNPSPGKRMACENIYKEYDRRRKERRG